MGGNPNGDRDEACGDGPSDAVFIPSRKSTDLWDRPLERMVSCPRVYHIQKIWALRHRPQSLGMRFLVPNLSEMAEGVGITPDPDHGDSFIGEKPR